MEGGENSRGWRGLWLHSRRQGQLCQSVEGLTRYPLLRRRPLYITSLDVRLGDDRSESGPPPAGRQIMYMVYINKTLLPIPRAVRCIRSMPDPDILRSSGCDENLPPMKTPLVQQSHNAELPR